MSTDRHSLNDGPVSKTKEPPIDKTKETPTSSCLPIVHVSQVMTIEIYAFQL